MRNAHKRRPDDFRRRILEFVEDREKLNDRENAWLSRINDEELGKRYYNLYNRKTNHWSRYEGKKKAVAEKCRLTYYSTPVEVRKERAQKIASKLKGRTQSEEAKNKLSAHIIKNKELYDGYMAKARKARTYTKEQFEQLWKIRREKYGPTGRRQKVG